MCRHHQSSPETGSQDGAGHRDRHTVACPHSLRAAAAFPSRIALKPAQGPNNALEITLQMQSPDKAGSRLLPHLEKVGRVF